MIHFPIGFESGHTVKYESGELTDGQKMEVSLIKKRLPRLGGARQKNSWD